MNENELRELLTRHNERQVLWAIGLAIASLILWPITYALVWVFAVILSSFVFQYIPTPFTSNLMALAVMAVLIFDAIRSSTTLFDLERFKDSFYTSGSIYEHPLSESVGENLTRTNVFAFGNAIASLLLCAPRSAIAAWQHMRNRVRIEDQSLSDAVACFRELVTTRDWRSIASFHDQGYAVRYLDTAELVWTRVHNGVAEVKLDPSARTQYAGKSAS